MDFAPRAGGRSDQFGWSNVDDRPAKRQVKLDQYFFKSSARIEHFFPSASHAIPSPAPAASSNALSTSTAGRHNDTLVEQDFLSEDNEGDQEEGLHDSDEELDEDFEKDDEKSEQLSTARSVNKEPVEQIPYVRCLYYLNQQCSHISLLLQTYVSASRSSPDDSSYRALEEHLLHPLIRGRLMQSQVSPKLKEYLYTDDKPSPTLIPILRLAFPNRE
jgi:hypothetical protein